VTSLDVTSLKSIGVVGAVSSNHPGAKTGTLKSRSAPEAIPVSLSLVKDCESWILPISLPENESMKNTAMAAVVLSFTAMIMSCSTSPDPSGQSGSGGVSVGTGGAQSGSGGGNAQGGSSAGGATGTTGLGGMATGGAGAGGLGESWVERGGRPRVVVRAERLPRAGAPQRRVVAWGGGHRARRFRRKFRKHWRCSWSQLGWHWQRFLW